MTVFITLNQIRNNNPDGRPCKDGWEKLLKAQGKTGPDDEPFPLTDVLDHNGIDDAHWCVKCLDTCYNRERYLYLSYIEESVLHIFEAKYPNDTRPRLAIQAMRDFAEGKISKKQMDAARTAARAAECAAAGDAAMAAVNEIEDTAMASARAFARADAREKQAALFRERFG
jgi:hypothetical protein